MVLPIVPLMNAISDLGTFYESFTTPICKEFFPKIVKEIFEIVKEEFEKKKPTLVEESEEGSHFSFYEKIYEFSEFTVNNLMRRTMKESEIHEMVENWWMELGEFNLSRMCTVRFNTQTPAFKLNRFNCSWKSSFTRPFKR